MCVCVCVCVCVCACVLPTNGYAKLNVDFTSLFI